MQDVEGPPPTGIYGTSPIKRLRATKAQVGNRWTSLRQIVEQQRPMTVRQIFYQATVHNLVEKAEAGYRKIQHALAEMRRAGVLPYQWIADNTRWQRKPPATARTSACIASRRRPKTATRENIMRLLAVVSIARLGHLRSRNRHQWQSPWCCIGLG